MFPKLIENKSTHRMQTSAKAAHYPHITQIPDVMLITL